MNKLRGEKTISDLTRIFHGEVNFIIYEFWIVLGGRAKRSAALERKDIASYNRRTSQS